MTFSAETQHAVQAELEALLAAFLAEREDAGPSVAELLREQALARLGQEQAWVLLGVQVDWLQWHFWYHGAPRGPEVRRAVKSYRQRMCSAIPASVRPRRLRTLVLLRVRGGSLFVTCLDTMDGEAIEASVNFGARA